MPQHLSIGIDLGTTNCALAFSRDSESVELFPVPQWVHVNEERAVDLLPSFLYLASPTDFASNPAIPQIVVGELAQKRGAEVPSRLVSSAKSWLCYSGIDRSAPILPPDAPEGVTKISPVEASARYPIEVFIDSFHKTRAVMQRTIEALTDGQAAFVAERSGR